jgi:uncharacterized protein YegP (UPF0339 family)
VIYFEIVPRKGGFRALCRSRENRKLIWWTEIYVRKAGARTAIKRMKEYAPTAPVYDRT